MLPLLIFAATVMSVVHGGRSSTSCWRRHLHIIRLVVVHEKSKTETEELYVQAIRRGLFSIVTGAVVEIPEFKNT